MLEDWFGLGVIFCSSPVPLQRKESLAKACRGQEKGSHVPQAGLRGTVAALVPGKYLKCVLGRKTGSAHTLLTETNPQDHMAARGSR